MFKRLVFVLLVPVIVFMVAINFVPALFLGIILTAGKYIITGDKSGDLLNTAVEWPFRFLNCLEAWSDKEEVTDIEKLKDRISKLENELECLAKMHSDNLDIIAKLRGVDKNEN